jgi:indole-3-glycerol phosphate synthase
LTILDEILEHKRSEVAAARGIVSDDEMSRRSAAVEEAPRGFRDALADGPRPRVIAELKRRSPSKGEIRPGFDPVDCARAYADGGAAALSVLTDEHYFGGHLDYLEKVRRAVALPLLRKDFVVDAYQIHEARVRGADAVLLIVAAFPGAGGADALADLRRTASGLGLDVLVEVHDDAELDVALGIGADLIGVNNRDLRTFEVDLGTTERLAARIPDEVVLVAESGIFTHEHVARLERAGARAFLVGESLMREPDVEAALRRLRGAS